MTEAVVNEGRFPLKLSVDSSELTGLLTRLSESVEVLETKWKDIEAYGTTLREEMGERLKGSEELITRVEKCRMDAEAVSVRVSRIESKDIDGGVNDAKVARAAVEALLARVDKLEQSFRTMDGAIVDLGKRATTTEEKAADTGVKVTQLTEKSALFDEFKSHAGQRILSCEESLFALTERTETMSRVGKENMSEFRRDVLEAMDVACSNNHTSIMKRVSESLHALDPSNEELRKKVNSYLKLATTVLLKSKLQMDNERTKRMVIVGWHVCGLERSRRRVVLTGLGRSLTRKALSGVLPSWRRVVERCRLMDDFKSVVDGMRKAEFELSDKALGAINENVTALSQTQSSFEESLKSLQARMEAIGNKLMEVSSGLAEQHGLQEELANERSEIGALSSDVSAVRTDVDKLRGVSDEVDRLIPTVKDALSDVILLWNNVKYLDATKADKKELDASLLSLNAKVALVDESAAESSQGKSIKSSPESLDSSSELRNAKSSKMGMNDVERAKLNSLTIIVRDMTSTIEEIVSALASFGVQIKQKAQNQTLAGLGPKTSQVAESSLDESSDIAGIMKRVGGGYEGATRADLEDAMDLERVARANNEVDEEGNIQQTQHYSPDQVSSFLNYAKSIVKEAMATANDAKTSTGSAKASAGNSKRPGSGAGHGTSAGPGTFGHSSKTTKPAAPTVGKSGLAGTLAKPMKQLGLPKKTSG